jgi:hypothetical protein
MTTFIPLPQTMDTDKILIYVKKKGRLLSSEEDDQPITLNNLYLEIISSPSIVLLSM